MRAKTIAEEPRFPEVTLHDELVALGDDDLIEMTNLTNAHTGIEGILFISTAVGAHGPRVKYFVRAGRHQPSFSVSISAEPRVLATSLDDRVTNRVAPAVIEWVKLNRAALLNFWEHGTGWTHEEVNTFVGQLKKLSSA